MKDESAEDYYFRMYMAAKRRREEQELFDTFSKHIKEILKSNKKVNVKVRN